MNNTNPIFEFLQEVETYQSNHYGLYDRSRLVNAYNKLSPYTKKFLTPSRKTTEMSWRGCDGLSETRVISFTTNKGYAATFGAYLLPFSELQSYAGAVSAEKLSKLNSKIKTDIDIGDDEGEIIVINPVWNRSLDLTQYRT